LVLQHNYLFLLIFYLNKNSTQDKYKKKDAEELSGIPFALSLSNLAAERIIICFWSLSRLLLPSALRTPFKMEWWGVSAIF